MAPDPLDRLYELPPGEFTSARDALAKELKAAGEKDAAAAVKALRRPSAAAWAVNAAARRDPAALRALLEAGEALHRAQERLLAGQAGRADLRAATDAEREAVTGMVAAASAAAREAGQPLSAAVEARVRETLHAATLDDSVREALASGRLERETEAAGFAGTAAAIERAVPEPRPAPAARPDADARREAKAKAEQLKRRREEASAALAAANRGVREAEREADLAGRRLERAEAGLAAAKERLAAAERREQEEREACREAQRALREAKAAAAAAQAAHDEAES